jgi:hypothetical protein
VGWKPNVLTCIFLQILVARPSRTANHLELHTILRCVSTHLYRFQLLPVMGESENLLTYLCTSSDTNVRELATVCLPWQQWAETSIWFDDVGISAFHSRVVVHLWEPLSEWRLLLSECVLVSCITTMHLLTRYCL